MQCSWRRLWGVASQAGLPESPRRRVWGQNGHLRPVLLDLRNAGPAHCALVEIRDVAGRPQGPRTPSLALPAARAWGCVGELGKWHHTLGCWPHGTPLPFVWHSHPVSAALG